MLFKASDEDDIEYIVGNGAFDYNEQMLFFLQCFQSHSTLVFSFLDSLKD